MGIFEFFYLVAVLLAGLAATAGYGVLSLTPGHYRIARRAFAPGSMDDRLGILRVSLGRFHQIPE